MIEARIAGAEAHVDDLEALPPALALQHRSPGTRALEV